MILRNYLSLWFYNFEITEAFDIDKLDTSLENNSFISYLYTKQNVYFLFTATRPFSAMEHKVKVSTENFIFNFYLKISNKLRRMKINFERKYFEFNIIFTG